MVKRIFIGIKIPIDTVFENAYNQIKCLLKNEQIKWVEKQNLHITLLFLGDIEDKKIPMLIKNLNSIKINQFPITISLKNMGAFKNIKDPRVIWVGINPFDKLIKLKKEIGLLTVRSGIQIEPGNSFKPHLTIGRVKYLKNKAYLESVILKYQDYLFQNLEINEFELFESKLTPSGPIYSIIDSFPVN